TINSSGLGTALAPGTTYLRSSWSTGVYSWDSFLGTCVFNPLTAEAAAFCDVQGCGDVRDQIIQEYITYGTAAVPRCTWFIYVPTAGNASEHFTYAELNRTNDYSWVFIYGILPPGLELTRTYNGNVPLYVTSGYRNPARNCDYNVSCTNQARDSQHIYGTAADLRTVSNWTQDAW